MFRLYRFLRFLFQPLAASLGIAPHSCRFTPSCSQYCELSFHRFGVLKGTGLCLKRISRCHPGNPPTSDPVPIK